MKQNIIITGGAGYVGASLCEALNALPEVERVVVYDELIRNDRRFFFGPGDNTILDKVHFVRGDILDTRRLSKAMSSPGCKVISIAWSSPSRRSTKVR